MEKVLSSKKMIPVEDDLMDIGKTNEQENINSHMDKNAFENMLPGKTINHWKSVPLLRKNSLEGKPWNIIWEAKEDPSKIKKDFNFPILDFNFL